jgi:hypothetical protein
MLPFVVSMLGFPPRRILGQGDSPLVAMHTPETLHMNSMGIKKGRNWHNQAEMGSSRLTQGLTTPSLKEIGLVSDFR